MAWCFIDPDPYVQSHWTKKFKIQKSRKCPSKSCGNHRTMILTIKEPIIFKNYNRIRRSSPTTWTLSSLSDHSSFSFSLYYISRRSSHQNRKAKLRARTHWNESICSGARSNSDPAEIGLLKAENIRTRVVSEIERTRTFIEA